MLNRILNKTTDEDRIKLRDQQILEAGEFEKLIHLDNAWRLYVSKIQKRIAALRNIKKNTKLVSCDDSQIKRLSLLEYQADILEWAITMPQQFINSTNKSLSKDKANV